MHTGKLSVAAALLCVALLLPAASRCETVWTYPLDADILANRQGYLTLANKDCLLDADFEPFDLVQLTVKKTVNDMKLRKRAAEALTEMFLAAQDAGYTLWVKSAYRSYQTQKTMYYNRLNSMGRDDGLVQYPGASDHQTGLGVDVLNYEWTKKDGMNAKFANEPEAQWMAQHCWEYGFVIRYELDKEDITGIKYEPWHLRYVGRETAAYMTQAHLCLEEFEAERLEAIRAYEQDGGDFTRLVMRLNLPRPILILETNSDGEEEYSAFY